MSLNDEAEDEREALQAIFDEEFIAELPLPHVGFSIRLNCEDTQAILTSPLYLSCELPAGYPESAAPLVSLRARPLADGTVGQSLHNVVSQCGSEIRVCGKRS